VNLILQKHTKRFSQRQHQERPWALAGLSFLGLVSLCVQPIGREATL